MLYQDMYDCICQNTEKWRFTIYYVKPITQLLFKSRFPKSGPTYRRQVVNPRHSNAAEYPSWVARGDIKGFDGTMLNPIFWKKVQRQQHPGRWEIAERQIPSVKMLFETNTKGHKDPSIRLFIIEQDTIGKPKKTDTGIQHRNRAFPKKQSYRLWSGAASSILNDTPCVCIYTSYNRTRIKNAYV